MKKEDAIKKVQLILHHQGKNKRSLVPAYKSSFKKSLASIINYSKYILGIKMLLKIDTASLVKPDTEIVEKYIVNRRKIKETKNYWIIPWGPSKFVEEFDIKYGLIGPGPFVVEKKTSKVYRTDSAMAGQIDALIKQEMEQMVFPEWRIVKE